MGQTSPRGRGFSDPNKANRALEQARAQAIEAIQSDPLLTIFVAALAAMASGRRRATILSLTWWRDELTAEDRAKVVVTWRPAATLAQIAEWSGCSERNVHRWPEVKEQRDQAEWRRKATGFKDRHGEFDAWSPDG